ncbi:MAG TPA: DISARM system SNF2-like helicase DrmD [Bellilinea sp.]|nr:DISARM system SNF2-like helicase DrmD [Bellilinea sp.]
MIFIPNPIPEIGQIVTVRQRRYAVSQVQQSAIPGEVLAKNGDSPQHLITLSSIEDDALGETLQVIWEIEPDARINEKSGLPDPSGFDSPKRFNAFLNAVRWGAISSADIRSLQAPFRSGITIEDYQLDPLVRAVQMPRANLLIGDDVGLGKTIEAGLIVQELLLRNRARTVMIVCPSSLQIQWRDQMRDKFGLEFRIVDAELMRNLRRTRGLHTNPWSHFPRLITSIDFLKRDRPMRLFKEILPADDEPRYPRKFDILIIDEAHNIAPVGRGKYATDSMRTLAIRVIAPHFEHKLFLTATPHNGYKESFTALLELLDNQRFARGIEPDRQQLQLVMVRRMKSELPAQFDGTPRFPKRLVQAIEVDYTNEEKQAHAWLQEYTELRQQNPKDSVERYATEFMMKMLKKRLFSSPAAFLLTLEQHLRTLQKVKTTPDQHKPTFGILRQLLDAAEEDDPQEDVDESGEDVILTATRLFRPVTPREKELLDNLLTWAKRSASRPDSKMKQLLNWLKSYIKPGGVWSNERVVIFTEYRATLNSVQELLSMEGFTGDSRLMTLFGGMDDEKREAIKAAFQAQPEISPVRILLATDAASEGIDLQNHCHRIIHMEIPWNPNRLEQRNGRLDRHGQTKDVLVHHFVTKGYRDQEQNAWDVRGQGLEADLEFLFRAVKKVEQIREDLGKVGPVIALQVEEAMLGKRRKLDTAQAERDNEPVRRMLKFERDLRSQIARHMEQLQETRQTMDFSPENTEIVVETALNLAGQRPLIPVRLNPVSVGHTYSQNSPAYELPALTGSWAACAEGLAHPHTGQIRPIVFDHNAVDGRDDVVLAHLNHRLVQMSLRLLRAEVWSPISRKGLHRLTAAVVPDSTLSDPAVIAFARLVVIGGDQNRLHEEIITAGGYLKEGRLVRMNVGQVTNAINAVTEHEASDAIQKRLLELYPRIIPAISATLEARSKDRMDGIQKLLMERSAFEANSIESILNELANSIRQELDEPEVMQLELFTSEEKEQLTRNMDALRRRLAAIPNEIDQEKKSIYSKFSNPQTRMFPVAVMFLVPR